MLVILGAKYGTAMAILGVVCSSWVAISRGSSHRSFLNPMGYTGYMSVRIANEISCRPCLAAVDV